MSAWPKELSKSPVERGTLLVTVALTDEAGTPQIPTGLNYTLTTMDGTVVNARQAVALTPAATSKILLKDADLQLFGPSDTGVRVLSISGTYNSTNGTGNTYEDQYLFTIRGKVARK